MNNGLVPPISELNRIPSGLVKESLPNILISVSTSIHHTSIAYDDSLLVCIKRNIDEDVLKDHLSPHHINLKANSIMQRKLVGLDHGPTFHEHGGSLRHLEHLKAKLSQDLIERCQGCGFPCARPSGQANTNDWMLTLTQSFWMVKSRIFHSC